MFLFHKRVKHCIERPDRIDHYFKQNILLKFSWTNRYLKPADVKYLGIMFPLHFQQT